MNFNELVAFVITNTNRPDMGFVEDGGDGRIPSAVQSQTLTMHLKDYFYKDIQPAQVVFDIPTNYLQTLDASALPRLRSLAYARKWDPNFATSQQDPAILPPLYNTPGGVVGYNNALAFFKILTPDAILDDYGLEKLDVCYQVGDTLYFKSSTPLAYAQFGWYQFPRLGNLTKDTVSNTYRSWIADQYPFAIGWGTVSQIFSTIGQQDQARKLDSPGGLVADAVEALIKSNVQLKGY